MAAVSGPETAETETETRGDEIRTADLVATALTRYAQAFATFGLMALVAAAFPALVVTALRGADARRRGDRDGRLVRRGCGGPGPRRRHDRVHRAAPAAARCRASWRPRCWSLRPSASSRSSTWPRSSSCRCCSRRSGSRPSRPGRGTEPASRPAGARLSLCAGGGYRRSLVPCAITASFAAMLFLAFGIALSPLGGRARVVATLVLWAAVAWPIAGLMLRSLYGALSGRLVVRCARRINALGDLQDCRKRSSTLGLCLPSRRSKLPVAPTTRTSRRSSRARTAGSPSAPTAWCTRRSASSAVTARACPAARSYGSSPPRPHWPSRAAVGTALGAGIAMGALANSGFGFFGFLVAFGIGVLMAEVVTRASGYYRGREAGVIAAGGSVLAYVDRLAGRADPRLARAPVQQLDHAAARVRRRRGRRRLPPGSVTGGRSRLRRARRVVVGGLVGGAVVMLDRRRRRARAAGAARERPARALHERAVLPRGRSAARRHQERLTPGRRRLASAHPERDARDARLPRGRAA